MESLLAGLQGDVPNANSMIEEKAVVNQPPAKAGSVGRNQILFGLRLDPPDGGRSSERS